MSSRLSNINTGICLKNLVSVGLQLKPDVDCDMRWLFPAVASEQYVDHKTLNSLPNIFQTLGCCAFLTRQYTPAHTHTHSSADARWSVITDKDMGGVSLCLLCLNKPPALRLDSRRLLLLRN